MSKPRLILLTVIITLVVLGIASYGLGRLKKPKDNSTPVRVQAVKTGMLTEFVSAPGQIEPKKKVSISARVSARLLELPFDEGQSVTCGDPCANPPVPASVLVVLDSKDLESQLHSVEAAYEAKAAQMEVQKATILAQQSNLNKLGVSIELAVHDLNRAKKLFDSNIVSMADYEQCKCKHDELCAELESTTQSTEAARRNLMVLTHDLAGAKAQILKAKDALSYTTITSPINGTVTSVKAEVGEVVVTGTMNNAGTVILEVADLAKMLFVAQTDESDIIKVKKGQKAIVRLAAFQNREFTGTVDSVALVQEASNQGGNKFFRTEILLDDVNDRLLTGLSGDSDIQTQTHADALKVPSQAVVGRPVESLPTKIRELPEVDKTKTIIPVVYRMVDGKAVATPVKIGPSDMMDTAILAGLKAGDKVIIGPYKVLDKLTHDQKVKEEANEPAKNNKKDPNSDANKPR